MTYSYLSIPNIPYVYGNLLPGGWANFSGQTHVFTIDPDDYCFNPGMGLNDCAIGMLSNVGFGSYNLPSLFTIPPYTGMPTVPMPDQSQINSVADAMFAPIANQAANQNIQTCDNAINASKPKLEAMLQDEKLSDEDKAKVQELLDKLAEKEEELKAIKENQDKLSPQEAKEKTEEIRKEITEIVKEAAQISTQSVATDDETVNNDDGKKEPQGAVEKKKLSALTLVDRFHDAVAGCGTDDKEFKSVCESINEDNVIDVMNLYKDTYKNSFMEDFMGDAGHKQRQLYGRHIARMLRNKAIELNILDKCPEFGEIFAELDELFIDGDIYQKFDSIIAKITEAENTAE